MDIIDTNLVHEEVPTELHALCRKVVRGFYGVEHSLFVDQLIRNSVMREQALREVLKFEPKKMREIIATLKNEKVIKERQQVEEKPAGQGGRAAKHNYYFMNYGFVASMVKYKIDMVRKKLNAQDRNALQGDLYKCTLCPRTYSDLDVGHLWNPMAECMVCVCGGKVEDDPAALPTGNARTQVARFNEQIEPIAKLVKQCEDLKFAVHILEPTPPAFASGTGTDEASGEPSQDDLKADHRGSGGKQSAAAAQLQIEFTNEMEAKMELQRIKEVPSWMANSTILPGGSPVYGPQQTQGSQLLLEDPLNMGTKIEEEKTDGALLSPSRTQESIERLLLAHETGPPAPRIAERIPTSPTGPEPSHEAPSEHEFKVVFGGQLYELDDITPDMVAKMSESEKSEYERVAIEYHQWYD